MDEKRRHFLKYAGYSVAGICTAGFSLTFARYAQPYTIEDVSKKVTIGFFKDLPKGAYLYLPKWDIHIINDDDGLYALSGRCSHLGCSLLKQPEGFSCPCHGGRFNLFGEPIAGPPNKTLTWYKMTIGKEQQIILHVDQTVEPKTVIRI